MTREQLILKLKYLKVIKNNNNINQFAKKILNHEENQYLLTIIEKHTDFLKHEHGLLTRLQCVVNNINAGGYCKICNKPTKIKHRPKGIKLNKYCSQLCSSKDPDFKKQVKLTVKEKYGVDNVFQSKIIKEKTKKTNLERYNTEYATQNKETYDKIKKTNIEKYGVDNPAKNEEIQKKIKKTNLKRYGVEYGLQNINIREKISQTNLRKYGVKHNSQSDYVKEKKKQTNLERYGVEYGLQNINIRKKITQTIFNKYGVYNPSQAESIKKKKRNTCLSLYGVTNPFINEKIKDNIRQSNLNKYGVPYNTQLHIPPHTLNLLNNKDWMYLQHYLKKKSLLQISKELNVSDNMVGRYLHNHGLITKKQARSQGEKELYEFIMEVFPNEKILENDRSLIRLELDIYIPSLKIAIEYNGIYWHSSEYKDKNYHLNKTLLCEEQDIRLIHIYEDEWTYNKELIKTKLLHIFNKSEQPKIYGRKTKIITIDKNTSKQFFNKYHIQGDGPGSIKLGLTYDNDLIAAMIFIKRKEGIYELNRYATNHNVIGGFSKLLKHFIKNYTPTQIVSFADRRWSQGNMYKKNGFELDKITSPDYEYVIEDRRKHKFNFRHKQLKNILEYYDPELTELQNTENHGLYRIYNCGLLRYVLNKNENNINETNTHHHIKIKQ